MEKLKSTSSHSDLVDEIANSMRKFEFTEEQITEMRRKAEFINEPMLRNMIEIIHKIVTETKWQLH